MQLDESEKDPKQPTSQTLFNITFDDYVEYFSCHIEQPDGTTRVVSSDMVFDILNAIAESFNYTPKGIVSESHLKAVLEDALGIKIEIETEW